MLSLEFFINIKLPGTLLPTFDQLLLTEMSNRNITCGKDGRSARLSNLSLSFADGLKLGRLKLLELYGPVNACNGVALLYISKFVSLTSPFLTDGSVTK
jgi:hypothetical protein